MKKLMSVEYALSLSRSEIEELHRQHLNPDLVSIMNLIGFNRNFVSAQGCWLVDDQGVQYLDCLGSYGAMNLGHNHQRIWNELLRVQKIPKMVQASLSALAGVFAHNLSVLTNGALTHSFPCNSGAEAVEGALKLARAATGRKRIVSTWNSFHGKTMGALSVTGQTKYQEQFLPLLPDCLFIDFNNLQQLEEVLKSKNLAAFIVEPVQGEGGVIPAEPGYLRGAAELCRRYGTVFILDEIQTGFGRTGYVFTYQEEDAVPDILCVAKSLGGGFMPVGAYITTRHLWQQAYHDTQMSKALRHTSTFGGNALAMAAGIEAMRVLVEEDLATNAKARGDELLGALKQLAQEYPILIKGIRGKGLLIGVEFSSKGSPLGNVLSLGLQDAVRREFFGSLVAGELLNNRILTAYTLNQPNVVRIEPPLSITSEEVAFLYDALKKVLQENMSFAGLVFRNLRLPLGRN